MIKTIVFDFGGVIGGNNNAWDGAQKRIKDISGLTTEELEKLFHIHWEDISINKKDFTRFLEDLVKNSKNNLSVDKLKQIYAEDVKIDNDVLDVIKNLKQKGYRVIILANDSKFGEKIRLDKINDYVDKVYSSATLQMRKPDPEIYKHVLKLENIQPDETLFIDDKQRNTVVAEALGIKSIVFKNAQQLLEDLRKYLH
jgi:putative hydrolase of the HAD superfamily